MPFRRLPETVHTLYAELLDQLRAADAEAATADVKGTFVSKTIRGRVYWYEQRSEGAAKRQIYLGPESTELLDRIQSSSAGKKAREPDERRRRELVTMLAAGGMFRESAAVGTVLRVLSEASVFRAGGVLVGTQAFTTIANLLGVGFDRETLRTADVDVAYDTTIQLGIPKHDDRNLLSRLQSADPAFFAVPGIDVREPSTSFKVRGRDLRVDFLTPSRGGAGGKPVVLPHLGVAARPLRGLDYLIEGSIDAAVLAGSSVLVNVPAPARYALHKLWLSSQRPASEAAKARKDLRQAEQLLEVLAEDWPDDVSAAWQELMSKKIMARAVRSAARKMSETLQERLIRLV
ncbi:MAG: GSU2403 family nucleotidyltransferase fold protein [Thermoanaerobaculia bacterium]